MKTDKKISRREFVKGVAASTALLSAVPPSAETTVSRKREENQELSWDGILSLKNFTF